MAALFYETRGLSYYCSPLLAVIPEVVHGFFTRRKGLSTGPYHSLNLSFAVGDRPEAVTHNRLLVQQALNLSSLTSATQVHGLREAVVSSSAQVGGTDLPAADILITTQPGVGLLIKQADCQVVMLYDPVHRVVANVHCGWRGQVQNILAEAVSRLRERFATRPGDLYAAIGPSLGPCCAEFRNFLQEFPRELWPYQVRPGFFDLWRLSHDQLLAVGLTPDRIDIAGLCTRCQAADWYSYRRDKITGRQGAVIALRP